MIPAELDVVSEGFEPNVVEAPPPTGIRHYARPTFALRVKTAEGLVWVGTAGGSNSAFIRGPGLAPQLQHATLFTSRDAADVARSGLSARAYSIGSLRAIGGGNAEAGAEVLASAEVVELVQVLEEHEPSPEAKLTKLEETVAEMRRESTGITNPADARKLVDQHRSQRVIEDVITSDQRRRASAPVTFRPGFEPAKATISGA